MYIYFVQTNVVARNSKLLSPVACKLACSCRQTKNQAIVLYKFWRSFRSDLPQQQPGEDIVLCFSSGVLGSTGSADNASRWRMVTLIFHLFTFRCHKLCTDICCGPCKALSYIVIQATPLCRRDHYQIR